MLSLTACYRMGDANYVRSPHALDFSKRYAVVQSPKDYGQIGQAIFDDMTSRGANVVLVDEKFGTESVDVLIKYEAAWVWDITWYPLALSISIYDAKTDALLVASARYRTSIVRSSSDKSVSILLDEVFGRQQMGQDSE